MTHAQYKVLESVTVARHWVIANSRSCGFRFKGWWGMELGCKCGCLFQPGSVLQGEFTTRGTGREETVSYLWFPWYKYPTIADLQPLTWLHWTDLWRNVTKCTLSDVSCGQLTKLTLYVLSTCHQIPWGTWHTCLVTWPLLLLHSFPHRSFPEHR